jgi:hypothetical protein
MYSSNFKATGVISTGTGDRPIWTAAPSAVTRGQRPALRGTYAECAEEVARRDDGVHGLDFSAPREIQTPRHPREGAIEDLRASLEPFPHGIVPAVSGRPTLADRRRRRDGDQSVRVRDRTLTNQQPIDEREDRRRRAYGRVSVTSAVTVNAGVRRKVRTAYRVSCRSASSTSLRVDRGEPSCP